MALDGVLTIPHKKTEASPSCYKFEVLESPIPTFPTLRLSSGEVLKPFNTPFSWRQKT